MKKKKIGVIIAIVAVIAFLLSYIISYANSNETIYVNLTRLNTNGIGYGIGDAGQISGGEQGPVSSAVIWNLTTHDANGNVSATQRNLYCIRANYGATWENQSAGGPNKVLPYNLSYDMQSDRQTLLNKIVDKGTDVDDIIKTLLSESGYYRELLWILDNSYIEGTTNKIEFLKSIGIKYNSEIDAYEYVPITGYDYSDYVSGNSSMFGYSEDHLLTDADIKAVQRAAIWYYTNYMQDQTYYAAFNNTSKTDWLTITTDGSTYQQLADYNKRTGEGPERFEQAQILYHYLIDAASKNKTLYSSSNNYTTEGTVNINTTGLTQNTNGKYELTIKEVGSNYVVGPIKVEQSGTIQYGDILLKVTNQSGSSINYTLTDENGTSLGTTDVKTLFGRDGGFYVTVSKDSAETVNVALSITRTTTKKTLWLKGAESTDKIELDNEQPLVEVTRKPETISAEFEAKPEVKPKQFDLALRKFITKVNDTSITSRIPNIDLSGLQNGTTAIYKHRKDPLVIQDGDVVTYTLRIYNEGEKEGFATEIVDQLPTGLVRATTQSSTVVSKDKNGNNKNTYTLEYEAAANKITLKITNRDTAKSLAAYTDGELDWETIEIKCQVAQTPDTANKIVLTNVAWISGAYDSEDKTQVTAKGQDRDSEPQTRPNVTKDNMQDYKGNDSNPNDLTRNDYFYEGEQDDDDFEKLIINPVKKKFDLELVKFIAAVSKDAKIDDGEYLTDTKNANGIYDRAPKISIVKNQDSEDRRIHCDWNPSNKTPLVVEPGDYVLYDIRVYNAGEVDGYASLIKDHLPVGLEFVETTDKDAPYYGIWDIETITDSNGDERQIISTINLAKGQGEEYGTSMGEEKYTANLLKALDADGEVVDGEKRNPDYRDVQVLCRVKENAQSNGVLVNYAQISADTDKNGNEIDDEDSTPNNLPESGPHEDDEDLEKIKVRTPGKYDLVLIKEDKDGQQLDSAAKFEVTTNGVKEEKTVVGKLTIAKGMPIDADHLTDDVYVIRETQAPDEYCEFDGTITITVSKRQKADGTGYEKNVTYKVVDSQGNDITDNQDANVHLNEDGNIYVEVKNKKKPTQEKYDLVLVKEDKDGKQLNSTAKFEVTTNGVKEEKTVTGRLTIAEGVIIDADHLTDDVYIIKETQAPDEYCKFDGTITITVTKSENADGTGYEKKMTYKVVDSNGNDITNNDNANVYLNKDGNIYVEVKNHKEPDIHKGVKDVTNQDSGYNADEVHTWVIESDIPTNVEDYKLYDIVDDIDYRLKFEGINNVTVKIGNATLEEGKDYKIEYTENANGVQNKTNSGTLKLTFIDTENSMQASDKVKNNAGKKIQVTFNTTFAKDENGKLLATMGEQIENQAKLEYKNSSSDNKVVKESEKPEVHTGGVILYKYYKVNDKRNPLAGAKFGIYKTEQDAKNNKNVVMIAESDENGIVKFIGLEYGEDARDNKDNLTNSGTYEYDADKASTKYWVAEIQAPDGYEKSDKVIEVTINKDSYNESKISYEVENTKLNFDLALRKFITKVQDKDITSRVPQPKDENGKITYEHTKEPVIVHVDDTVIYTLRIYNEGTIDGYATEIADDIPEYLEYLPEDETNVEYKWKMYDENGNETTDVSKAVSIRTKYLSRDNGVNNLLKAYDGKTLDYKDVKVAFKVKDPNSNQIIITNKAQIFDDSDKNGDKIDDIDSKPGEWNEGEDDQDVEHVKVEYFDLALLKFVSKVIVIEDGKETISETGYDGHEDPEPVVKVDLHKKKLSDVTVKFGYGITIINEGDIPGYAKEITDYIPEGLRFEAADNPLWTDEGNNVISTKQLENTLLQPGETATVEVILTWINDADNMGLKTNTAEISQDKNEYDVPDRDSTPDNRKEGEDDIDIAKVILAISTGTTKTYFMLTTGLLLVVGVGIVLIKKYVIE